MAIFPTLEHEAKVQVNDRTRIEALKTFADKSGPVITKVEIEPYAGAGYIDVTGSAPLKADNWYTDYAYDTAGSKVITLRINDGGSPVTVTSTIEVISAADDALFASDADLTQDEPDVLRYVRKGRNTFKDVHREAQKEILDFLDRKGYRSLNGDKISKDMVVDKSEVRTMAKYLALHLIYSGISNVIDDIFSLKASTYWSKYLTASDRKIIGLDLDDSGDVSLGEGVNTRAARLVRK